MDLIAVSFRTYLGLAMLPKLNLGMNPVRPLFFVPVAKEPEAQCAAPAGPFYCGKTLKSVFTRPCSVPAD